MCVRGFLVLIMVHMTIMGVAILFTLFYVNLNVDIVGTRKMIKSNCHPLNGHMFNYMPSNANQNIVNVV